MVRQVQVELLVYLMQVELQVLQALLVLTAHQQQAVVVEQVEVQMEHQVLRVARPFLEHQELQVQAVFLVKGVVHLEHLAHQGLRVHRVQQVCLVQAVHLQALLE